MSAPPPPPLLRVDDLRVRFGGGIDAVCGASLELASGKTMALVGESGSGKTTLAFAIAGLVAVGGGTICINGADLRDLSESARRRRRRGIGVIFQDPIGSLSPRLSVRALITEPLVVAGLAKKADLHAEARRLLDLVGLPPEFAARYPYQLSGGQARRVGVARALALAPKLILADEPTAGLDVSVQGEVLNLLAELRARLGFGILLITHNLNVVRHIADQTAIMYLGRIVERGDTAAIFARPRHPYTLALLSANPAPDPDSRRVRLELRGEAPSLLARPAGCEFHPRCPFARPRCRAEAPPPASPACHYPLPDDIRANPAAMPAPQDAG